MAGISKEFVNSSVLRDTYVARYLRAGGDLKVLPERPGLHHLSSIWQYQRLSCHWPVFVALPHLACSAIELLVRKKTQKEHMFSSGAFSCAQFASLTAIFQ